MMDDPTRALVARFVYLADQRDRWCVLDAPDGPLRGDCEDFALTALWLLCGRSWWVLWWRVLTFQAMLWNVTASTTGESHVCLWVRGRGWIDNINPGWSATSQHGIRFPYLAPILALVLVIK